MYKKAFKLLNKLFRSDQIIKYGFNYSPMYRRSLGKIKFVSKDIHCVDIEIKLSYKNRNYAGSIFGGSLFSATDPIYMVQLIQILGEDYIVWDKSAHINYKKPAKSTAFVSFKFSPEEITEIRSKVQENGRLDIVKTVHLLSKDKEVFAELEKTIFISTKAYYKAKTAAKSA